MITFVAKMLRLPKFINNTLSVRLSLMVVSAMAILLMASLIVILHFSRKAVKEEALQKASQTLEGTTQRIDNILLSVEQATGNIYFSMQPYLDQPEKMYIYSRRLVESNPYIDGCAIAFKPYYYKDRELFMAYSHRNTDSHNADGFATVQSETFGDRPYTEQVWYTEPMATGKPDWLNPLKGMNVNMEPIFTFSLPIPGKDGKPVGIIGVDVSLNMLSKIVLEAKPSPNSYCTLLADDGSYIVHPDSNKLQNQTVFTESRQNIDPAIKEAAKAMLAGATDYRTFKMNGTRYCVFFKPFKRTVVRGRSLEDLGWSAGIIYPEEDIFGDYNRLLNYVLAIAVIGLLLIFILSRTIIHRQLLPLRMLTTSAQHIAKGHYTEMIPDSRHQDEIGRLQNHFQQMQLSLANNIGELEQLTATLKKRGEELRTTYEQVSKANRLKTVFLHNMTDQMLAPANTINNDVDMLCRSDHHLHKEGTDTVASGSAAGKEATAIADDIMKQGKTITDLLNDLLQDSEKETGKEAAHD